MMSETCDQMIVVDHSKNALVLLDIDDVPVIFGYLISGVLECVFPNRLLQLTARVL
jgi:hypothetical protein